MACHLLNLSFIGLTFSVRLGVTLMGASRNGAHKRPRWSLTESLASECVVILSNTCVLEVASVPQSWEYMGVLSLWLLQSQKTWTADL